MRHPWQLALSVLGVALGVAVVVSIDLANASAERAFGLGVEAVSGRATHQIVAGERGIDESVYVALRVELGLQEVAPAVTGNIAVAEQGLLLRVLGIDPFAEAPIRERFGAMFEAGDVPLSAFLVEPGTGVLAASTAERLGIAPGDELAIRTGTRRESLRELMLARALYRCGDRDGLGEKILRDYIQDLRGHLARHAKAVLEEGRE
jgi:putative ABC transport system permease protein